METKINYAEGISVANLMSEITHCPHFHIQPAKPWSSAPSPPRPSQLSLPPCPLLLYLDPIAVSYQVRLHQQPPPSQLQLWQGAFYFFLIRK